MCRRRRVICKKVMSKGYDARFAGNEELNGDFESQQVDERDRGLDDIW